MQAIMGAFHEGLDVIGGEDVIKTEDYSRGLNGLPASDVLKFYTENSSVVIRPSGTEPKLKAYISITAPDRNAAETIEAAIRSDMEAML